MSQAFASRHDQKIVEVSKGGYSINSAGATISTNKMVKNVLIFIQEREYMMDLIVLPGLSIDVILGMKWMSDHGVLIDTSTRTIMLREPKGGNTIRSIVYSLSCIEMSSFLTILFVEIVALAELIL